MEYIDKKTHDLLEYAISLSITDIHFDISNTFQVIRFRRHKKTIETIHNVMATNMYEHLKFIANFDLSQKDVPQTGRFMMVFERNYYFRFAAIESFGRKNGVVRILNIVLVHTIFECIRNKRTIKSLLSVFQCSSGLVLYSGGTGSGKSTTLFNTLKELKQESIYSIENPIERYYEHVVQLEPIRKRLSNEDIMNQLLRMDADVLVYGEVRTKMDLQLCLKAVNMGHLVCATIHSRGLVSTLDRLYDLGATHYAIESSLVGILYHKFNSSKGGVLFQHEFMGQNQIIQLLAQQQKTCKEDI